MTEDASSGSGAQPDPAPAAEIPPITQVNPPAAQPGKPRPGRAVALIVPLLIILASLFYAYQRQTREKPGQPGAPSETRAGAQDAAPRLEGELNRALREAGFVGVTTAVGDDGEVTLSGTVSTERDKEKAFALVESFKGVGTVKDLVFVVEQ